MAGVQDMFFRAVETPDTNNSDMEAASREAVSAEGIFVARARSA